MKPRRSLVRLTLAGALVFGPACEQQTSPSLFDQTPPFPIPTPTLTCSAEQSSSRYANFKVTLTGGGDNTPHSTIVDFGDGFEERDTLYSSDRGPRDSRSYSHRYERNGTYVISGTVRNTITNDRLSCTRTVVFDRCEEGSDFPDVWDDFTFDGRWSRNVVKDSPGIVETASVQRSGGNPDGYQRMTHEFTTTTAPVFVSMFVYHVFQGTNGFRGPIDHIRYREDRIKFSPLTATSAVGSGALIVQNGVNHVAPLTGGQFSNSSNWERVDVTLQASDFTPVPDFSRTAAPMFFGYYRANSNRFPLVIEHGIDNWRVYICR